MQLPVVVLFRYFYTSIRPICTVAGVICWPVLVLVCVSAFRNIVNTINTIPYREKRIFTKLTSTMHYGSFIFWHQKVKVHGGITYYRGGGKKVSPYILQVMCRISGLFTLLAHPVCWKPGSSIQGATENAGPGK